MNWSEARWPRVPKLTVAKWSSVSWFPRATWQEHYRQQNFPSWLSVTHAFPTITTIMSILVFFRGLRLEVEAQLREALQNKWNCEPIEIRLHLGLTNWAHLRWDRKESRALWDFPHWEWKARWRRPQKHQWGCWMFLRCRFWQNLTGRGTSQFYRRFSEGCWPRGANWASWSLWCFLPHWEKCYPV